MSDLVNWTREFYGEKVTIIKGNYVDQHGTFKEVTGYSEVSGAIVTIQLDSGFIGDWISDLLTFDNSIVDGLWNKE